MKYKKTVLIIIAVAVLSAAAVVIIPMIQGSKPVSNESSQEPKTTFEAMNIKPGDINCINLSSKSKGTTTITDSKTIAEIVGIVNTSLTESKTAIKEGDDDITIYFYKGKGLLGSIRANQKDCTIGNNIYMTSSAAFDMEKLMSYIKVKSVNTRPKGYDDLMTAVRKLTTLTDSASLMGGMKDYVNKLEEYFKTKAYWEIPEIDAMLVDISCMHPSQDILVINYIPDFRALGKTSHKWCLVFYDDGSGKIKGYRALEDEDILITDTKIFRDNYLLLAGACSDASTAVIGYEIKNDGLTKSTMVEECSADEFKVSSDTLLSNKNLSPVSFISSKVDATKSGAGFKGFTDEGFSVMFSGVVNFSFDGNKKLFTVKGTEKAGEWSKQEAVNLYKNKFFKDMAPSQFPANIEYEEIDSSTVTDLYGRNIRVSICYILPDGFVSEKTGEYEIDGCGLNVDHWSTPSITGIYAVINDSDILTLDDAVYSRKYSIKMQELYEKLPERFRDLKYISLDSSQMKELEDTARGLVSRNLEAFSKIFILSMLPADVPDVPIMIDENEIFPVKSDKYKTFADLENFVRSTYIKRTADRLLYDTFGQGPMYLEKDGIFCVDFSKEVGVGYYRDWRDCPIKITDTTETLATVTVTVKEFDPGDEAEHPQDISFKMIKQDGNWLLTDMIR